MEFSEFDGGLGRSFSPVSVFVEEAYTGFERLAPAML
jgi:hypothetical protein